MTSDPQAGGQENGDRGIRTVPAVLDRIAVQFSDHDAVVTADRRLTYRQLRDEVRRAAAAMIDLGVAAGDRVVFTSGEHMETKGATNTLRLLEVGEDGRAEGLGEL